MPEFNKVLIDGDVLAYRAAFSHEDKVSPDFAIEKVDSLIREVMTHLLSFYSPNEYEVYATGKGNFRSDIAKTAAYKGNRKDAPKPTHLQAVRDHLVAVHKATMSSGEEADDMISIRATELGYKACIASIDKDFLQVPCWHYNISKQELSKVNEIEGLRFFYSQILTGDRADNIIGLHGIGPKKAEKALADCKTEGEMLQVCVDMYNGDLDRVIENGQLLWLRRKVRELWYPKNIVSS